MIYLIVLILILAGIFMYDYRHMQRGRLLYWIILLVFFICVAGFRYRMGMDSIMYENYFNWGQHPITQLNASDFQKSRFAPLFIILAGLAKSISDDFMVLQFIVSIIVNCTIFYFLYKNTKHIFFALLLYYVNLYLNLNMEVLREALAVSVFLLAWPFFRDGKWWAYYGMCFVAILCHISAFVLFFLPLCCLPGVNWFFKVGTRTWIICLVLLVAAFAVNQIFFQLIQKIAFTENMMERAQVYSKTDLGGNTLNILGILSHLIKFFIYPFPCLFLLHSIKKKKGDDLPVSFQRLETMSLMGIYVGMLTVAIAIFSRYNNYFLFFVFVVMADCYLSNIKINNKKIKLGFLGWTLLFIPYFGTVIYTGLFNKINKDGTLKNYMMYFPYTDAFNKDLDINRERLIKYKR